MQIAQTKQKRGRETRACVGPRKTFISTLSPQGSHKKKSNIYSTVKKKGKNATDTKKTKERGRKTGCAAQQQKHAHAAVALHTNTPALTTHRNKNRTTYTHTHTSRKKTQENRCERYTTSSTQTTPLDFNAPF